MYGENVAAFLVLLHFSAQSYEIKAENQRKQTLFFPFKPRKVQKLRSDMRKDVNFMYICT